MFVCQWHLDVPNGKQGEAVRIMREWGREKLASSEFRRAKSSRVLVGHIGLSASHVVDEYEFESLADFEAALAGISAPQFRRHSKALAPYVIPGSRECRFLRVIP